MNVPFVFDRVVFADRAATMNGANFLHTQRTTSEAFTLPGSPNWWSTFRNVIESTDLNASTGAGTRGNPVITAGPRGDGRGVVQATQVRGQRGEHGQAFAV